MRIAANILVVLLTTVGAFWLVGSHFYESAYRLFAPAGAELLFPYDRQTIGSLTSFLFVSAAHVLFLSIITLWIRRWRGWPDYAFRWVLFSGALLASVLVFISVGWAYSHFSASTESRVYAPDLPVTPYIFAVFLATVAITLSIRSYKATER